MDIIRRRMYFPLLFFIILVEVTGSDFNDTTYSEEREPRSTGRIVKLYSGTRQEPILCTGEGFQKDPYNCAVFYRCVMSGKGKYTLFRFQCGPGTVYDPDTEVCNHPQSTKRSECGGYISPVVDTTNSNEIESFNNEIPSPIMTNIPIYPSSAEISSISTEKLAITSSTPFTTTANAYPWGSSNSNNYPEYSMTVQPLKPTSSQQYFTESTNIPDSNSHNDKCTSDGFMGDSQNCRKFYRCVANGKGGFTKYEFTCTETTIWDEDYQICNHVWAVKRSRCSRQNNNLNEYYNQSINKKPSIPNKTIEHTKPQDKSNSTIQQQLQLSYGSKVTQIQTQISNGSVVQNQTQIHYGDRINDVKNKTNRQNQDQVSYGSAVSQSQMQLNYGNQGIQTQLQVDHSKEASQAQVQIIDSPALLTSTPNIIAEKERNSSECAGNGFIGDAKDCHKFYRCVNDGKGGYSKIQFSCAEGTVWDQSILACNHAWAVKECGLKITTVSLDTVTNTNSNENTTLSTAMYTTTSTENYSDNLESVDRNDDNGYITQKPSHIYTSSSTSTTAISSHTGDTGNSECTSSGFMGDNNNCKIFYRCVQNSNGGFIKYEFKCGEGTVWDAQIEACNHAWAVEKCGGNALPDVSKLETTTKKIFTTTSIHLQNTTVFYTTSEKDQNDDDEDDNNLESGYQSSHDDTSIMNTSLKPPQNVNQHEFVCKTDGFFADKYNCEKFYRCVEDGKGGFTRYEFACSKGTLWDDNIGACNHASAVERCGEITTKPYTEEGVDNILNENNRNITTLAPSKTTITTTKPLSMDSSECTQSGFISDPKYCNKFYKCVDDGKGGFMKHDFSCGEGTYWNQEILSCEHITSDNECGERIFDSTTKHPEHQYEDISTTTTSKNDDYITKKPVISAGVCTSEGFYGDKDDCKKFYRCVDNGKGSYTKYDFACGDGTIWDEAIQACNHGSEINCNPTILEVSPSLRPPSLSQAPSNNEQSQPVSTSTTLENNEIKPQITEKYEPSTSGYMPHGDGQGYPLLSSNEVCSEEGYYGNKNNCKEFYRCVDNGQGGYTKYSFICSEGTAWDSNIQGCNYIEQVTTCQGSVLQNEDNKQTTHDPAITSHHSTSTEMSTTLITTTMSKPQPTSQTNIDTIPNSTTQKDASTLLDSETSSTTTFMQTTSTTSKPNSETNSHSSNCESEGYFGDGQDCKKFYRCVDNGNGRYTKYEFDCAEGTIWDQDVVTCNHPESVVNPSCNKSSNSNTSSSHAVDSSATQNQDDNTKKPENDKIKCTNAGFYPNLNDCKKFYRCVDWDGNGTRFSIFHFECGEGTIWDPSVETCNHEGSVYPPRNCSGSQNQGDNHTSTTENTTTQKETTTTQSTTESSPSITENTTTQKETTTTQSTTESSPSITENTTTQKETTTTQSTTDSNSESTMHSTPKSTTQSTTQSETESTSQSETQLTTQSESQTTSQSTLQSTQQSTSQSETQATTQSMSESTTQSTSPSTTQSTTPTTTQSTSIDTTQSTVDTTTTSATQQTTEYTTSSSTEQITTSTESITSTTTDKSNENTTEINKTTTEKINESTTEKLSQSTTEEVTEGTTEKSQEPTTDKQEETTTKKSEETTTEKSDQTTTEKLQENTTEKKETTTTEKSQESTTEKLGESTTDQSQSTTTEKIHESTTEKSTENTTEQSQGTTEQAGTTETSANPSTQGTTTETSTTEQSTSEYTTAETTTDKNTTDSACPETEKDEHLFVCPSSFRRHPKYCNLFYQCDENEDTHDVKIAMFTCPNNTIYDQTQTKCVEESKADKKCTGEIAQKRRVKRKGMIEDNYPIAVSKDSFSCLYSGYFVFEKDSECSPGFLKCETKKSNKLRGFVYQCPTGYVFWSVSRRCEPINIVSDCKRSFTNDWSRRWEIPVESKNIHWS